MCPVRVSGHMVLAGSWGPALSNSGLSTFYFLASTPSHASACTDFNLPLALKLLLLEMLIWSSCLSHGELLFTLCFLLLLLLFVFIFYYFYSPFVCSSNLSLKSVLTPYLAPKHLSHLLPNKIAFIIFYCNLPIYKVHLLLPPKWLDIAQMHAPEQVHSRSSVDIHWMTEWSAFKG